jgi:hypothetical protein
MQFLIDVPHSGGRPEDVFAPLGTLDRFGTQSGPAVRLPLGRLEMTFQLPEDPSCRMWTSRDAAGGGSSFVYVLGWCYRIGSAAVGLTDEHLSEMLTRHRAGLPPADDETSGNYIVIAYDESSGRLAVQPDQYAMRTVHFAVASDRVTIGNRAALVAAAVGAPFDGHTLLSVLRGAHVPFGRSLFAGVRRILSGCFLTVDTRVVRAELRRATPLYVETRELTQAQALDAVCETVSAIGRRLTAGETTVFDLTGGVDSRLLAAAVRKASPAGIGDRFLWNVVGTPDHPDVVVAKQVAQVLGLPLNCLLRVPPGDAELPELEQAAVLADGFATIDFALSRLRYEGRMEPKWIWYAGGMSGELLRGFLWNQEFFGIGRSSRVDYRSLMHYRIHPSRALEGSHFGSHWPTLDEHDEVILGPYRELGDLGGDRLNPYKLDVMMEHRLVYYGGNTMSWLTGIRRIRLPFASWEYCRLVLAIPWKRRATRHLQLDAIARLRPELRGVPTVGGSVMTALTWSSMLKSLPMFGKSALPEMRRGFSSLGNRILRRTPKGAAQTFAPPPPSWASVLREARHVTSIVEPEAVRMACDQTSPTAEGQRAFYALLTLELLCRALPRLRHEAVFAPSERLI